MDTEETGLAGRSGGKGTSCDYWLSDMERARQTCFGFTRAARIFF